MKNIQSIFIFLVFFLLMTFSTASKVDYGYFKLGDNIPFFQGCTYSGDFCDSCFIQSIRGDKGVNININSNMSYYSQGLFNYTFDSSVLPYYQTYDVIGYCKEDLHNYTQNFIFNFGVSVNGEIPSNSKIISYSIFLLILGLLISYVSFTVRRVKNKKYTDFEIKSLSKSIVSEKLKYFLFSEIKAILYLIDFLLIFIFSQVLYSFALDYNFETSLDIISMFAFIIRILFFPVIIIFVIYFIERIIKNMVKMMDIRNYGGITYD